MRLAAGLGVSLSGALGQAGAGQGDAGEQQEQGDHALGESASGAPFRARARA